MNTTHEKIYMEIGQKIKKARQAMNMSQEELSSHIGLTRTSITNIEKGRQQILVHTLLLFCEVLHIHPNDLLPSQEESYERALKELAPEHRSLIENTLKARS